MLLKKYGLLLLLIMPSIGFAFNDQYTQDDCSPITGNIGGDLIIKCSNNEGEISISYDVKLADRIENIKPLEYKIQKDSEYITIEPIILPKTDLIEGMTFPMLDIKISNNKDSNLTIDEALLKVSNSVVDKNPYVKEVTDCSRDHIKFRNLSPFSANNVEVSFNITPTSKVEDQTLDYDNLKYIENINIDPNEYQNISIVEHLKKEGADVSIISEKDIEYFSEYSISCLNSDESKNNKCSTKEMEKLRSIWESLKLGEFRPKELPRVIQYEKDDGLVTYAEKTAEATVYGYFSYDYFNYFSGKEELKKEKFSANIPLLEIFGCGDYMADTYTTTLKSEGREYIVKKSLSQKIAPRDSDRFIIKMGARKSSYHELEISLHSLEHGYLPSRKIKVFIPNYLSMGKYSSVPSVATIKAKPHLNIRNDKNKKSKVIGKIKHNSKIKILGHNNVEMLPDKEGYSWVKVEHDGVEGYIYDKFIVYDP